MDLPKYQWVKTSACLKNLEKRLAVGDDARPVFVGVAVVVALFVIELRDDLFIGVVGNLVRHLSELVGA